MVVLNNTTEAVEVQWIVEGHSVIGDLIAPARYCVASAAVIVNAAIAIAFLVQKLRRPTAVQISPTGLLVINLLLVDTLVGVIMFFNLATNAIIMTSDTAWCGARLGLTYLATIGSHIALLNVVVDRFIAIGYTLKYRDWVTWRRSVVAVCCGWLIPVAGAVVIAVVVSDDWYSGTQARCSEVYTIMPFVRFVWIPTHFSVNLCVVLIQCRVYMCLKRHDAKRATSSRVQKLSDKSAWILFRITTPTYIAMLFLDVTRVIMMVRVTQVTLGLYQFTLLFVQIVFLMNPLVYSYATGNIRKPVMDLYGDLKKCLWRPKLVEKVVPDTPASETVWVISVEKSSSS